jgi:hypothetical protein
VLVLLRLLRDLQAVVDVNYDMQGSEHSGALLVIVCGWGTFRICHGFLGAFTKLRKATVNLVMSVCQHACPSARMEQLCYHWSYFHGF